jgi:hypothetical protein
MCHGAPLDAKFFEFLQRIAEAESVLPVASDYVLHSRKRRSICSARQPP